MARRVHWLVPNLRGGEILCGVPRWMSGTRTEQDVTCKRCLRVLDNKDTPLGETTCPK